MGVVAWWNCQPLRSRNPGEVAKSRLVGGKSSRSAQWRCPSPSHSQPFKATWQELDYAVFCIFTAYEPLTWGYAASPYTNVSRMAAVRPAVCHLERPPPIANSRGGEADRRGRRGREDQKARPSDHPVGLWEVTLRGVLVGGPAR